jgi:hypothetical protein
MVANLGSALRAGPSNDARIPGCLRWCEEPVDTLAFVRCTGSIRCALTDFRLTQRDQRTSRASGPDVQRGLERMPAPIGRAGCAFDHCLDVYAEAGSRPSRAFSRRCSAIASGASAWRARSPARYATVSIKVQALRANQLQSCQVRWRELLQRGGDAEARISSVVVTKTIVYRAPLQLEPPRTWRLPLRKLVCLHQR